MLQEPLVVVLEVVTEAGQQSQTGNQILASLYYHKGLSHEPEQELLNRKVKVSVTILPSMVRPGRGLTATFLQVDLPHGMVANDFHIKECWR